MVDDEQWIYFQRRRIATLPVDLEPDFYWDPETFNYWLRFPDSPEQNLQSSPTWPYQTMPEQTPRKPEFILPVPESPPNRPER